MQDDSAVFALEGSAVDHEWILGNRVMIEQYMYDEVRDQGCLPILDTPTALTYEYNEETENFDYKIEMLMYHVGLEKAREYWGILLEDGVMVNMNFDGVALVDAL